MAIVIAALIGICIGMLLFSISQKLRLTSFQIIAKKIIHDADLKANSLTSDAESLYKKAKESLETQRQKTEQEMHRSQEKIDRKQQEIDKREKLLKSKEESFERRFDAREKELERIAGLTRIDARETLISDVEKECKALLLKKYQDAEDTALDAARDLIFLSISRISDKQITENAITVVSIPTDDLKAKLIGREGRNIKSFEQATGTTLIIDDAPNVIVISSFDPLRRHIAKRVLEELILDPRIHPARIEELVKKMDHSLANELIAIGESAASRANVQGLHVELLKVLGKLHFRSSLGQNVLDHSVEVSHLMGIIAAELQLNEQRARRIGLLHDIGKALDASSGKSHAVAGYYFALSYGEKEEVANGIGCHHDEMKAQTKEGSLCKPCDTLSATRPFARVDSFDSHFRRLENLETLAKEFSEVESAFVLQAGRELRVFVKPDTVDDLQATKLAHLLSKKIEERQPRSGKVQVTVIREKKVVV